MASNGSTTAVTIDTAQNVGVGGSPSAQLHVIGNSDSYFTSGVRFTRYQTAGQYGTINFSNGTYNFVATDTALSSPSFHWRFSTDGSTVTNPMTLDNSGNLLVGTTNTNPVASAATGIVALSSGGIRISNTGSASYMGITTSSGTQLSFYTYSSGAVLAGAITNPTSNTTAYTSISDYRLKENITPMSGALSVVNQLKPCTYDWISDKSKGQGFIAHELQALVPDCVIGEKDAVDKEGNPKYQSVDTSFLIATLTSAIQELSAKVTALEAKVA